MRYHELFEDMTAQYFHITTKSRLKTIMIRGIEPGHKRRWENTYGGKLGKTSYVYLISDFTGAVRWAAKMEYNFRKDQEFNSAGVVILALKNVPGAIEPHENIESYGKWFQVAATIPPQCITRTIELTRNMVRELIAKQNVMP